MKFFSIAAALAVVKADPTTDLLNGIDEAIEHVNFISAIDEGLQTIEMTQAIDEAFEHVEFMSAIDEAT